MLGRVRFRATPATRLEPMLVGRQLTLLRQVAPAASRVGVLLNPSVIKTSLHVEEAAQRLAAEAGTALTFLPVREAADQAAAFEAALSMARETGLDGLIVLSDPMMKAHRRALAALAGRYRLPAIFDAREFVGAGGLMSCAIHAPVLRDFDSLLASYDERARFDPVKAGAEELDLAVNRSAAAALGLAVPSTLQIRSSVVRVA
jgi:putative ABC transport system substrate-binding protein